MVGTAIGAALEGMRPIVEMQFADFSSIALNQILNNAGTHYWRTNIPVPITVRLPSGGTKGSGPFHSQSMESLYAHYPGLIVMTPATVEDAYTMLIDAVAIDDPVVYCEHKYLYYHLKADDLPSEGMPIGRARIARAGRDLTIVSYSAMLQESLIPHVPVIMPQIGESIAEATIVSINVKPGEKVAADQEIMEVETNKAVMGVTTPCAGEIAKIDAQVKETYPIGGVLGYIEASEKDAARFAKQAPPPEVQREMTEEIAGRNEETAKAEKTKSNGARAKVPTDGLPVPAAAKGAGFLSPRVRARMAELQLTNADLAGIAGTGSGNRVTIKDLENYLRQMESQTTSDASAIRTGVADAMRRSWSRPLATIGSSVNLDPVLTDRKQRDPKPGPALYALRALALALAESPAAAAKLVGARVLQSNAIDIGLAIEAQDGIIVPIIRNADKTSLADLTTKYEELVSLGRARRISPEMQSGGIAAVSNFGTFGVEWGTPIPLPEQTMILGLGVGKKTPRWDESKSEFVPITEAQITLSFDHRSLDGGGAGRLLKRVIELLEEPTKL